MEQRGLLRDSGCFHGTGSSGEVKVFPPTVTENL